MVSGSPLLRPRDADALRAELRRVAEESGMPLTFGGEVHEDRFTVAEGPSGLFVYTGHTPTDIVILEIQPPARLANKLGDWDPVPPTDSRPTRATTRPTPPRPTRPSPGRSGFPSAY